MANTETELIGLIAGTGTEESGLDQRSEMTGGGVGRFGSVKRVNIAEPSFTYNPEDPDGFRGGTFRFGPLVDAEELGTSVYELPPGQSICPFHYEYAEEEWLLVLAGAPTVRHPDGSDQLSPWDVVCFPRGPRGAHEVRNDTEETVRVLMYSTVKHPAATVYPDSDKIAIWTGNREDDLMVHRSSGVDYWSGEPPR